MFLIHSTADGQLPAWNYLPCAAITPKIGLCLSLDSASGQLKVDVTSPQYICMKNADSAVAAGTNIPVIKITKEQVWESTLDGATAFKLGTIADVASGGLLVDGDGTTNKVFLIEYLEGTEAGNIVRGRFVK